MQLKKDTALVNVAAQAIETLEARLSSNAFWNEFSVYITVRVGEDEKSVGSVYHLWLNSRRTNGRVRSVDFRVLATTPRDGQATLNDDDWLPSGQPRDLCHTGDTALIRACWEKIPDLLDLAHAEDQRIESLKREFDAEKLIKDFQCRNGLEPEDPTPGPAEA